MLAVVRRHSSQVSRLAAARLLDPEDHGAAAASDATASTSPARRQSAWKARQRATDARRCACLVPEASPSGRTLVDVGGAKFPYGIESRGLPDSSATIAAGSGMGTIARTGGGVGTQATGWLPLAVFEEHKQRRRASACA
jgi:hypothetical protein